jgi:hypothetical protein
MATCNVTGTVLDPSATPISGVEVDFNIQRPILSAEPVQGSTTTASDGTWSMLLQQGLSGVFTINTRTSTFTSTIPYRFNVNIPNSASATFSSILVDS